MKIVIVVQGRFHAFDLGRALLKRGHDVTMLTNYPKWAVTKFGFPRERVRSFALHGVLSQAAYRMSKLTRYRPESWLNALFGRWADKKLARLSPDVIHPWSGISKELLENPTHATALTLLMRGSSHIRTQGTILREEELRTGVPLDRPDEWIQQREEAEYAMADHVVVLSRFAFDSFCQEGFDEARLHLLLLGASTEAFRPSPEVISARCERILSGEPLRVIYVGALSLRKGLWDVRAILRELPRGRFHFRLVGPVLNEAQALVKELSLYADIVPKQPQSQLKNWYGMSDLFLFPTLEDGFPIVLAQAKANGLPILTTPNCSGPDTVREGQDGWVLPIRNPGAFAEKLLWCDANRPALAEMVRAVYAAHRHRTWDDAAADFEALCVRELSVKNKKESRLVRDHMNHG